LFSSQVPLAKVEAVLRIVRDKRRASFTSRHFEEDDGGPDLA
jgi:hypothetical protein